MARAAPKRILFVDDEPSIRLTLPPVLQQAGFYPEKFLKLYIIAVDSVESNLIGIPPGFVRCDVNFGDELVALEPVLASIG